MGLGMVKVQIRNGELDPVRPASLRRYISSKEWDDLVDDIGDVLQIAVDYRYNLRSISLISFIVFILLFFGLVYSMFSAESQFYSSSSSSNFGYSRRPLPFLNFFALFFIVIISIMVVQVSYHIYGMCHVAPQVERDLDDFLQEFSRNSKGGLTLHLKEHNFEMYTYINEHGRRHETVQQAVCVDYVLQISVDEESRSCRHSRVRNGRQEYGDYVDDGRQGSDDDTNYYRMNEKNDDDDGDRIQKRLKKLEKAKKYLSREEYDEKRQAILDDI